MSGAGLAYCASRRIEMDFGAEGKVKSIQLSVILIGYYEKPSAKPLSGMVNSMVLITARGDHDRWKG